MRVVFSAFTFLGLFFYSHGAYVTPLGSIEPCLAPCIDYGLVITPRGNSSRLKISGYKFDLKKEHALRPSDVTKLDLFPDHVPFDLAAVFKRSTTVGEIMMPLIQAAKDIIPPDYHSTSTILFSLDQMSMALNEDAWFRVLGDIQVFFANKTVPFLTGEHFIEDVDDFRDASYRWLTMNFVRGLFKDNSDPTVATLSFNGVMQCEIAYEKLDVDSSIQFLIHVEGTPHPVVTSTFFRTGSLYPLNKYFEVIANQTKEVVSSPCGPKGLRKKFVFGKPGVKWIEGTGQIEGCRNIIREKLFKLGNKMNGFAYLKHKVKGKVYAMPNVAETMKKLGYKECTKDFTPYMLDKAVRKMCGDQQSVPTKIDASKKMQNKQVSTKNGARPPLLSHDIKRKRSRHQKKKFLAKSSQTSDNHQVFSESDESGQVSESGIIDCVYGNFLYLMLSEAYYLAPDTKIHVNVDVPANVALDSSLGELLFRMQILK